MSTVTALAAQNLDDLKAAPIGNLAVLYDGAPFFWSTTGAPYDADDINVIKSDFNGLSVGAWIRQSASKIGEAADMSVQDAFDIRRPYLVGLFSDLGNLSVPETAATIQSSGFNDNNVGIARYVQIEDIDQDETIYRKRTANGILYQLAEDKWTFDMLGGNPDAVDNSIAWDAAVAACIETGKRLSLTGGGTYRIPNTSTVLLNSHFEVFGDGQTKLDGSQGDDLGGNPTLFSLITAGLTFNHVPTTNLCLINDSNDATTSIDKIDLTGWRPTNNESVLNVSLRISNGDHAINELYLNDVHGIGGVGGVHIRAQVLRGAVDKFVWKDINVPNYDRFFDGPDMINTGFASALNLGLELDSDTPPTTAGNFIIGDILIDGILDERIKKAGGATNSGVDGVRIELPYTKMGNLTARNIDSQFKTDTTALYSKADMLSINGLTAVDCGRHEASVVFKGNNGGVRNIVLPDLNVTCTSTGYNGRCALAMEGIRSINIGNAYFENMGGFVENPYNIGTNIGGSGVVIYSSNADKNIFTANFVHLLNCVGASASAPLAFIALENFKTIYIPNLIIDGASNAGLLSTQSPGEEIASMYLLQILSSSMQDIEDVTIGNLIVKNLVKRNNAKATAIWVPTSSATIKRINILGGWADGTLDYLIGTSNGAVVEEINLFNFDTRLINNGIGDIFQFGKGPNKINVVNSAPSGEQNNIALNGAFASDTVWVKGTGWAISSGSATHTSGNPSSLTQSLTLIPGQIYAVKYTQGGAGGSTTVRFTGGTTVSGISRPTNGTYVDFLRAVPSNAALDFAASSSNARSISNVSVTPVS